MAGFNRVLLMGALERDPEVIEYGSQGKHMTKIVMRCERKYQKSDGSWGGDETLVPVVFFRKTAAMVADYCTEGMTIFVEGRISTRERESKSGGKAWLNTEVMGELVTFLPGGGGQAKPAAAQKGRRKPEPITEEAEQTEWGDIPF